MGANIIIPSEISKEYFKVVDFEDANQRDKPKGRFFRSVRLYLTDIMIDICYNWRKFWQKNGERELMRLVASDESDLSDLSDTNLLTRQLANLLTR